MDTNLSHEDRVQRACLCIQYCLKCVKHEQRQVIADLSPWNVFIMLPKEQTREIKSRKNQAILSTIEHDSVQSAKNSHRQFLIHSLAPPATCHPDKPFHYNFTDYDRASKYN